MKSVNVMRDSGRIYWINHSRTSSLQTPESCLEFSVLKCGELLKEYKNDWINFTLLSCELWISSCPMNVVPLILTDTTDSSSIVYWFYMRYCCQEYFVWFTLVSSVVSPLYLLICSKLGLTSIRNKSHITVNSWYQITF